MQTRKALRLLFTSAALPLFLAAALTDWAYKTSFQIQWMNFSSWLIIGAMVFATLAILAVLVDGQMRKSAGSARWLTLAVLLILWVLGFNNALVHARDGWAMMPTGFILSLVCALLACIATWSVFSNHREGDLA